MTENKRFILVEYVNKGLFIQDNANDETQYFQGSKASLEKVVDLLNDLSEENEQLKKDCTVLIYHNQEYRKENEQLKAQLYCDSEEGVCSICKHHYVEKTNMFYISKCEKGHEECSTDALKHCKDFELKELQE